MDIRYLIKTKKLFAYIIGVLGVLSVIVLLRRYSGGISTSVVRTGYSEWEPWGQCTPDCGISVKSRTRHCYLPVTEKNFSPCKHLGPMVEVLSCKVPECKLDGKWGQYGSWSACEPNCQDGFRTRQRECDTPAPKGDGLKCKGAKPTQRFQCTGVKGVPPCNRPATTKTTSKPSTAQAVKVSLKPMLTTLKKLT